MLVDDAEAAIRMLAEQLEAPPRVIDAGTIAHAGGETRFACILSAGFDAHRRDPIGGAGQSLEEQDFAWATRAVVAWRSAKGRQRPPL